MRNVHYISQTGTSGYANAAKGYVYDLIKRGINVKWTTFLCDQSLIAETSEFDGFINKYRNNDIPENEIDTVIIHSTPDIWQKIIEDLKIECTGKTIIGRTVWEFNKLVPEWVECINTSQVTEVSVPTSWNKTVFANSEVKKPIVVEPHVYVDYPYKKIDLDYILQNKCTIIYNKSFDKINFNFAYKFYTIGQFISRKGISETISAFCRSFTGDDNVILLIKTFKFDHSYEEQIKCLEEIINCIRSNCTDGNHPPIVFIKENLTYDEMQSLHDMCNCYIQLTKTEGFGLGIFEAYNKKKEIIVTGYGGQISFLDHKSSNLVDYKLQSINNVYEKFNLFNLDESYVWANPSIDHAVELFKKIYNTSQKIADVKDNVVILSDGWYDLEKSLTSSFRWSSVNTNIICKKQNLYDNVYIISQNLFNNKKITFSVKKFNSNVYEVICEKVFVINENIKVSIPISGVEKIKITSDYYSPFEFSNSDDKRKLSLQISDFYFEKNGFIFKQSIANTKHENDVFYKNITNNNFLVNDVNYYFDKNNSIPSFDISKPIRSGIILYLPNFKGKHLKCLDNLNSYKHSNSEIPIIVYTDSDGKLPNKYKFKYLKIDPLPKMEDGIIPAGYKYATWAFFEAIKIAKLFNFDYFFCYEWDCKIGKDYWYDTLWQEHLNWPIEPVMTGTPVFKCPLIGVGNLLQGVQEYRYAYSKECKLYMNIEHVYPFSLYTNGALTFYNTKETEKYFFPELNFIGNPSDHMDIITSWDLEIGIRLFKDLNEKSFEKVGWLPSSYSGCGDYYYNQQQRDEMLTSGLKIVIHQNKYL